MIRGRKARVFNLDLLLSALRKKIITAEDMSCNIFAARFFMDVNNKFVEFRQTKYERR